MPISLIIFDLDGTLVDTSQDLANSLNHALAPHGMGGLTPEYTRSIVGEGVRNLITKILAPVGREDLFEPVLEAFISHYSGHLADQSTAYPGVADTLDGPLGMHRKAVLSNKRGEMSRKLLGALGLASHFELIAGPDDVPEQKPEPGGISHLIEKLGVKRDEAIMVGDSQYDVQAGQRAGIRTVAVAYGFRPREVLLDADVLIDRFSDLPAAIKGLDGLTGKENGN